MASAEVDEADARRHHRDGLKSLAVATAAAALVSILCCLCLLLYPSASSTLPTSLVYPPFAEAAVKRAAAITAVASTDDYTATAALGNGTFGRVVQARHRGSHDDDVVAIKSLIGDANSSYADSAAEVLSEARLLAAAAGHPSVVALRAIAVHPSTGELSLVMEHAGHSLFRELYLHRGGEPFAERDALRVMRRLLAGVEHMHSRGVVHRDIKPENVLVVSGDDDDDLTSVKICDMGLAVPTDQARGSVGMSNYMAPEILAGKESYSDKVVIWSLGAVMAELLGGKRLFYVENDDYNVDDAVQLRVIYDVLGPPCPGDNSEKNENKAPTSVSDRNRLRYFFPKHRLSDEGFDVLKGLLSCDADRRLSAANALRLPWFADVGEAPSVPSR